MKFPALGQQSNVDVRHDLQLGGSGSGKKERERGAERAGLLTGCAGVGPHNSSKTRTVNAQFLKIRKIPSAQYQNILLNC